MEGPFLTWYKDLIAQGVPHEQAWEKVSAAAHEPESLQMLRDLLADADGRTIIAEWLRDWDALGVRPPWYDVIPAELR